MLLNQRRSEATHKEILNFFDGNSFNGSNYLPITKKKTTKKKTKQKKQDCVIT
jgi:hypothetical protein